MFAKNGVKNRELMLAIFRSTGVSVFWQRKRPLTNVFLEEKKKFAVGRVEQKILEELMTLSSGERTFVSVFSKKRKEFLPSMVAELGWAGS